MSKDNNQTCQCEHCVEIINQQNRLEKWQNNRLIFNHFIEKAAKSVRPDL